MGTTMGERRDPNLQAELTGEGRLAAGPSEQKPTTGTTPEPASQATPRRSKDATKPKASEPLLRMRSGQVEVHHVQFIHTREPDGLAGSGSVEGTESKEPNLQPSAGFANKSERIVVTPGQEEDPHSQFIDDKNPPPRK